MVCQTNQTADSPYGVVIRQKFTFDESPGFVGSYIGSCFATLKFLKNSLTIIAINVVLKFCGHVFKVPNLMLQETFEEFVLKNIIEDLF